MISSQKIKKLNLIIKKIYSIQNSRNMRKEILNDICGLIDCNLASFALGIIKKSRAYLVDPIIVSSYEYSFGEAFINANETQYHFYDYAYWTFLIPESIVYKDTDLINDRIRKKTVFYQDYLLKYDLPYIAGISLADNRNFLGALTFFRSKKQGDFSDEDIEIFELLLPHLQERLASDDKSTSGNKKSVSIKLKSSYDITDREAEIIGMVFSGYNNSDISSQLFISENTVKKHLSNIYTKLHISSRPQLVKFIIDHNLAYIWG